MIDFGFCQSEIPWGDTSINEADIRRVLQGIKDVGASRVRMVAGWNLIDKPGQPYNFDLLDRAVNLASEYGLKPLLVMSIAGDGHGGDGSPTAFGNWCKATAQRYGPEGSNRVDTYEIWNEENWSLFFTPTTAAAYTEFLKPAHSGIKSVHSSATVITGGTVTYKTWSGPVYVPPFTFTTVTTVAPDEWVQGIYNVGGGGFFDGVGYHWYSNTGASDGVVEPPADGQFDWEMLQKVRAVMVAQGDAAKNIWPTEMGYAIPERSPAQARDYLKAQFDLMAAETYFGPPFLYSYRDTGNSAAAFIHHYGAVDINYTAKEPYRSYIATIRGADNLDVTPPTAPTNVVVPDVTSETARVAWGASTDDVGVTQYRVYLESGTRLAETAETATVVDKLTPGTSYRVYVTAVDAAGNESAASALSDPFTTDAPAGLQAFYQYDFTGTGSTVPVVFEQVGLGYTVTGGVATHNTASVDGKYYTVAPYYLDHHSPDHFSEITLAAPSSAPDLAAMAVVRMKPDGTEWVAALSHGGGTADGCQLITFFGGRARVRKAVNASALAGAERLRCTPVGNVYTVTKIDVNNVETELFSWTDTTGVFPGVSNRRSGLGWQHIRSGSVNYNAPGVTGLWRGADVTAIQASGGVSDAWILGVLDDNQWSEVIATNLWEAAI